MKHINLILSAGILLFFVACQPLIEDKVDIGQPPAANFDFSFVDDNNVTFTNTTADPNFIASWDMGSLGVYSGNEVEVNFPFAGDYEVTLSVFGRGGSTSTTKTVTISTDDPDACSGLMIFMTDCSEKTWKLNPDAGALWVGPDDATTWWANSAEDVVSRACDWNDEYIFSDEGTYQYKSQGDLWGETYMGFGSDQCYDMSELPSDRADWGDGSHSFELIPGSPARLRVIGNGAFLGLRKAANGSEVMFPQPEVTYDILDMRTEGSTDIIELEVNFGGGLWRFTLASS